MAFEIFKLMGSIMVDSSKAEESISKTDKKAESLGTTLAKGAKTAGKWAAGLTAGAIAAGGAMIAAAKDQAAAADVIDKAAIRMGISAESYQELEHVANLSGVSIGALEKAAKKLDGTEINLDQALDEIMAIEDESERAQRAAELFGDSVAYEMTPLLGAGAEGMVAMRQEANDLGLVMSGDAVAAGAAMNDAFYKVEASLGSLKTGIMSELMPVLMKMLDWVVQKMPEIRATIQGVVKAIKPMMENLIPVIESLFTLAGKLWESTLKPVLNGITAFISGVFAGDWSKAWNGITQIFSGFANGLKTIFQSPINWIIDKLNSFLGGLSKIKIPDWVPGVGGKGFEFSTIPKLAQGGVLEKGQTGFLEGNGAEAVVPLENNRKWIHAVAADMASAGIGGSPKTEQLLAGILDRLEDISRMGIVLDTGAIVGGLAGPMDRQLGRIAAQKARG